MKNVFTALIFAGSVSLFAGGAELFTQKGCVLCHQKDQGGIAPSLRSIAIAYLGKEGELLRYLQGRGNAIVNPDRAPVMQPQLIKIRTLYGNDIRDLAEYILSAADRPF